MQLLGVIMKTFYKRLALLVVAYLFVAVVMTLSLLGKARAEEVTVKQDDYQWIANQLFLQQQEYQKKLEHQLEEQRKYQQDLLLQQEYLRRQMRYGRQ